MHRRLLSERGPAAARIDCLGHYRARCRVGHVCERNDLSVADRPGLAPESRILQHEVLRTTCEGAS